MARRPPKGKRGGGKKRSYTMSPKARAQRRVAARKHGLRAATVTRQVLPACNRRQCPLRDPETGGSAYPCQLKQAADEQGMVVESCPLPLAVNPQAKEAFLLAIRDGKLDALAGLTATSMAAQAELAFDELRKVKDEGGLSIQYDITGPSADGGTEVVATGTKTNPRAFPLLKLLDQLGHTAAQQTITPKEQGEKKFNEGVGGFLDALRDQRRRVAGAIAGESET